MRRFLLFAFVFPLSCFANLQKEHEECPDGKQLYRTTIRHIESGGIGYEDGYTTFEAFLSSDPTQWAVTPFLDARGHVFDNGKWAANVGIGLRALWENRAYGINTYYDYRSAGYLNSNQIGVGLETLGALINLRINGYFPLGTRISDPYNILFGSFFGNSMLISEQYQSAMTGGDAEFGVHFGKFRSFDLYGAAGPYYFTGQIDPTTWGGKARLSATFRDFLTLEISDSYDGTFHNKFQGQVSLNFFFGSKSKVKAQGSGCKMANTLTNRMLQPIGRQEIIVIDTPIQKNVAIDPATGLPYFFVFVNNTSNSDGTYESPYHSFAQVQAHSSPNDIIYVFPGDKTTTGMDSGITLKANQKLWGSGVSHLLETSEGTVSIPAQSSTSPSIENANPDTLGNAITLATNNAISGFTITSNQFNAMYGSDPQNLEISSCTFNNVHRYVLEAEFFTDTSISVTNNQFLNNTNGISMVLHETSTVVCSDNTFEGQSSPSETPISIDARSNTFTADIENNVFNNNSTGCAQFILTDVVSANMNISHNTMTHNTSGSYGALKSNIVIKSNGTIDHCSVVIEDNLFSENRSDLLGGSNSFYMHTDGEITNLEVIVSKNTLSNNKKGGFVLATPVTDNLTFVATDNTITGCEDNAIAVIANTGLTVNGDITINNNTITNTGTDLNPSSGITVPQNFSTLRLTILNNEIDGCTATGIASYASTGIDSFIVNISDNTISNCQNIGPANAASGINIQQYINLSGSITNNTLSNNVDHPLVIGSALTSPNTCITFTGNVNDSYYVLTNPIDGVFNLSPCDADSLNVGTINTSGTINRVQSCPDATPCSP